MTDGGTTASIVSEHNLRADNENMIIINSQINAESTSAILSEKSTSKRGGTSCTAQSVSSNQRHLQPVVSHYSTDKCVKETCEQNQPSSQLHCTIRMCEPLLQHNDTNDN
jgi:hypothetical protein